MFNINQIYDLKAQDVKVYRDKGRTYIDANYESRTEVFGRIDSVMKFDDLEFEAGRAYEQ